MKTFKRVVTVGSVIVAMQSLYAYGGASEHRGKMMKAMHGSHGYDQSHGRHGKFSAEAYPLMQGWGHRTRIAEGRKLFARNCAVCHGKHAEGKGRYPSLNGTRHVGHHAPSALLRRIANGGGGMPPFKGKLSKTQRENILIYLHAKWPARVKKHYDSKFNIKD